MKKKIVLKDLKFDFDICEWHWLWVGPVTEKNRSKKMAKICDRNGRVDDDDHGDDDRCRQSKSERRRVREKIYMLNRKNFGKFGYSIFRESNLLWKLTITLHKHSIQYGRKVCIISVWIKRAFPILNEWEWEIHAIT